MGVVDLAVALDYGRDDLDQVVRDSLTSLVEQLAQNLDAYVQR